MQKQTGEKFQPLASSVSLLPRGMELRLVGYLHDDPLTRIGAQCNGHLKGCTRPGVDAELLQA